MQKWMKVVAMLIVCSMVLQSVALAFSAVEDKIVIAIVDFKNTSNNAELDYLEKAIPESIITSMAQGGQLEIVERGRLQDAISEMQLGMSGIVDEQTAVEVGRAVGASAILVGSFVTIGEMIQINARLIDVSSSKIIKADTRRGQVGEEIFDLMDQMAQSMEYQMVGDRSKSVAIQQVPQESLQDKSLKKTTSPIYTKWWFWGIVAVGAGGAAYALSASGGESNTSSVTISVPLP